jgi:hypothetical protein
MFISKRLGNTIYIAEKSKKGDRRLLWSMVCAHSLETTRVEVTQVPNQIREQAYNMHENDKLRGG